jgi:hypothetical protein
MWNGGDSTVRSATWACFVQNNLEMIPAYSTWDTDEMLLLRDGISVFEIHRFVDGTERLALNASSDYFRDGIAHWRPDGSPSSLDVTKTGVALMTDANYKDTTNANVHFHLEMRLSSGKFTSRWSTETASVFSKSTSTEEFAGQCILLPKPPK